MESTIANAVIDDAREVTVCPACGKKDGDVIGRAATEFDSLIAGLIFRHPSYNVKKCANCGLYYKTHVLTGAVLNDYYKHLPFESFESESLFPTDSLILQTIVSAPKGARILDFGCGIGRILSQLTKLHRCYGVEVNERAAEVARSRGIAIISQQSLEAHQEENFDFVILSDVFEHLPEPLRFLRTLAGVLSKSGALVISSGNGDAIRERTFLSGFWYFRAPGHLQMLSGQHINWCARMLGLRIGECYNTSHYSTSFQERVRQWARAFAFEQFHLRPKVITTRVLGLLPVFRRAAQWPLPPALTCTRDHLVVFLRNT